MLVVGDICLDRWCTYDPALADLRAKRAFRASLSATEVTPGAGGTVANNLAALGVRRPVLGVMGDDGPDSNAAGLAAREASPAELGAKRRSPRPSPTPS